MITKILKNKYATSSEFHTPSKSVGAVKKLFTESNTLPLLDSLTPYCVHLLPKMESNTPDIIVNYYSSKELLLALILNTVNGDELNSTLSYVKHFLEEINATDPCDELQNFFIGLSTLNFSDIDKFLESSSEILKKFFRLLKEYEPAIPRGVCIPTNNLYIRFYVKEVIISKDSYYNNYSYVFGSPVISGLLSLNSAPGDDTKLFQDGKKDSKEFRLLSDAISENYGKPFCDVIPLATTPSNSITFSVILAELVYRVLEVNVYE